MDDAADSRFLRRGLKISHLRLLRALARTGQMSAAADALGVSQPAASRLAAEAERIAGAKLYERTSRGIVLTVCGEALARRVHHILDAIGQAERELAEIAAGAGGTVNVGAVTGPAVEHMLPAIRAARVAHPAIAVNMEVATSDVLAGKLLDGSLDFALARRPRHLSPALFRERVLAPEPVRLIVRSGHPLLRRPVLRLADTVDYDWVLPLEGTLLRTTLEAELVARGIPLPGKVLNTSSILLTLVMVNQTNAVAPMAAPVAAFFSAFGAPAAPVCILPLEERPEVEPYALLLAAGRTLTPAARTLYDLVSRPLDAREAGSGSAAG
ncbi:LysR family transcriptional regulator [Azospirillum halopraeferens]|uniref:LysR family transcriptional regulator n=1 Tax=Azospirillum halopraeferens TaxID=34010 RepID=UPI000410C675|nr:LysR family transcriptional regulator [Azospirillum halopraeferens]